MLGAEDFAHLVRVAPLVAIDLVICDPDDRFLLGLRSNEPAKGTWFVPGGCIRKNERFAAAFVRILADETGLKMPIAAARPLGAFEHFYETNRFSDPGYGTHYVVLAYALHLDHRPEIRLDEQHSAIRWMSAAEILAAAEVHENTKAYFR